MTRLTADISTPSSIPYFMWDEPMTVAEIEQHLKNASKPERIRLMAKILREARDTDAWRFFRPADVAERWDGLASKLGRRRAFWEYLLAGWREEGLIDS